jgi:hypoxanthine phosphoribosyltransferase
VDRLRGPASFQKRKLPMTKRFKCDLISWARTYELTRRLSLRILKTAFRPDLVVAIGRGGYVPARIVCDFLEVTDLTAIKIEHWGMGAQKQDTALLRFPLNVDVSGQKILVVDDVTDTGDTLRIASTYLLQQHPAEVRTAVVQHKTTSYFIPDYYGQRIVKWRWIIYPWAVVEDLTGFLGQMDPAPHSSVEAAKRLIADYGLQPPQRLLEYIFLLFNEGKNPNPSIGSGT